MDTPAHSVGEPLATGSNASQGLLGVVREQLGHRRTRRHPPLRVRILVGPVVVKSVLAGEDVPQPRQWRFVTGAGPVHVGESVRGAEGADEGQPVAVRVEDGGQLDAVVDLLDGADGELPVGEVL